jgi:hypothetical protein
MARAYKRDAKGRFAGGGSAVTTTYGRAGGFASRSVQVKAARGRARNARRAIIKRRVVKAAAGGLGAALATGVIAGSASRVRRGGSVGKDLNVRARINTKGGSVQARSNSKPVPRVNKYLLGNDGTPYGNVVARALERDSKVLVWKQDLGGYKIQDWSTIYGPSSIKPRR